MCKANLFSLNMNKFCFNRLKLFGKNLISKSLYSTAGVGLVLTAHLSQAAIFDPNGNKLPDAEVNSAQVSWKLLKGEESKKYNGVGLLEFASNWSCTAFFIKTGNNPQAPAYAVTNGHCYDGSNGLLGANEIIVNRPSRLVFKLNYFANETDRVRSIGVRRVAYATMKNTDLAILELDTTFDRLVKEGFTPLTIDKNPVRVGEPVEVIGIPMDRVDPAKTYLHKAVCAIGQSANVREDVYNWKDSVRNRCSVVGGMSGSPMISVKSNRVVAIVNTGVNDEALPQPECSLNRPCEVSKDGNIATLTNENYAQKASKIPYCFNRRGIFNLKLRSCGLEKPL